MTWRTAEAIGYLRSVSDNPLAFDGLIPYGQLSVEKVPEYGRKEAFGPGTFKNSVEYWMQRSDGAKMPYRPAHKERPNGTIQWLRDEQEGVAFRLQLRDTPAGHEHAEDIRSGLNGISPEFMPQVDPMVRDGFVVHREAKLYGIAGSASPAYDGARLSLRDMEEPVTKETPEPEPQPEPEPPTEPEAMNRDTAEPAPVRTAEATKLEREQVQSIARGSAFVTRPEAVYGPQSGQSYFRDMFNSHDGAAQERLQRHNGLLRDQVQLMERAGDVISSEIPGAFPNEYLPGLLVPRILKGRPMGGFFDRQVITDANPKIYPKVTTSTTVAVQSAESANPAASDLATTATTVTPLLYGGVTDVSRQVLDGASPGIDTMLMQDLTEAYAQASETVIKTAVEAGATAASTAITLATPFAGTIGNIIEYFGDYFLPAQGVFFPPALYAVLLAQNDTTGRPLVPFLNPINSQGNVQDGASGAMLMSASVFLSYASTVNVVVTARQDSFVILESALAQFRFDQPVGPAAVRIGIWAYLGIGARKGSNKVTAA